MTVDDRNTLIEAADILMTLGGNNGFGNLQPKLKRMLSQYGKEIKGIVERDIQAVPASGTEALSAKEAFLMNH